MNWIILQRLRKIYIFVSHNWICLNIQMLVRHCAPHHINFKDPGNRSSGKTVSKILWIYRTHNFFAHIEIKRIENCFKLESCVSSTLYISPYFAVRIMFLQLITYLRKLLGFLIPWLWERMIPSPSPSTTQHWLHSCVIVWLT